MNYENQVDGYQESSIFVQKFLQRVYLFMFAGLMLSGVVAYFVVSNPPFFSAILKNQVLFFGLIIVQLGLVILLSALINKMSPFVAGLLFFSYAALTGMTLSVVLLIYSVKSIVMVLGITSLIFGMMSLYGFFTKTDLTSIGRMLIFFLVGVIIATVINLFLRSGWLDYVICYVGIGVFMGLTAYDTQKIKSMAFELQDYPDGGKYAIVGALSLYLDFINIFLYLLRIFGRRD